MTRFPHDYTVSASACVDGFVDTLADGKPILAVAPPRSFGGPGDIWSPEELLLAALADCYILTFRALAKSTDLEWRYINCVATGVLDRDGPAILFTSFNIDCELEIGINATESDAMSILNRAKQSCFVSRALAVEPTLQASVRGLAGEKA